MMNARNDDQKWRKHYNWTVPVFSNKWKLDCIVHAVVEAVHTTIGEQEDQKEAEKVRKNPRAFDSMKRVDDFLHSVGLVIFELLALYLLVSYFYLFLLDSF